MSCKNNQIIQDRYETGTQNGMEVGSSLSHYISGKQSVGWSHSCLQCAGKSIGHTADIMQEFNLAWGSVRWVINPVKVLLPSTPLFRGWMGLWMGCSGLPGFSFRIQDFLPNTEARAAAADSGKSRVQVSSKWEIWETIEGAQWVAGWLAGRRLLWKYWKMLVFNKYPKDGQCWCWCNKDTFCSSAWNGHDEAMKVDCSFRVGSKLLPQVEGFLYVGVLLMSYRKM